jgi:hypothetical protein
MINPLPNKVGLVSLGFPEMMVKSTLKIDRLADIPDAANALYARIDQAVDVNRTLRIHRVTPPVCCPMPSAL